MLLLCLPRNVWQTKTEQEAQALVLSRLGGFVHIKTLSVDDVKLFEQVADCSAVVIFNISPDARTQWCIEVFGQLHKPIFVTDGKKIGEFKPQTVLA